MSGFKEKKSGFVYEITSRHRDFFDKVKELLPPNPRIFYPGCGPDKSLTNYFQNASIVHLDKDPDWIKPPNFVLGEYDHLPFQKNTFDMLFACDNHATESEFNLFLDTLKRDGIVVFEGTISCGPYTLDEAITNRRLRPLGPPSLNIPGAIYQVFRKL